MHSRVGVLGQVALGAQLLLQQQQAAATVIQTHPSVRCALPYLQVALKLLVYKLGQRLVASGAVNLVAKAHASDEGQLQRGARLADNRLQLVNTHAVLLVSVLRQIEGDIKQALEQG